MKKNYFLLKATFLAIVLLGINYALMATTFTANTTGSWSSTTTWGGTAPGFSITSADNIIVPVGVAVTLDGNLTINNAAASLSVAGTLTGPTYNIALTAGTLTGTLLGTVTINNLTVGAAGLVTTLGPISVSTLTNSQAALAIASVISVSNTLALNAGVVQLNTGGAVNLAAGATINMAGGSYSIVGGGLLTLGTTFNLLYSGSASTIGLEAALIGLQNITVNLSSATSQLSLSSPLAVLGTLSLQQGVLNLNGNTLTINGGINTAAAGTISGTATSNIIVNSTGSVGTIAMASGGKTINNLTLNILASGSVSLASDITVAGALALNGSNLNLNGNTITLGGTVTSLTGGSIVGSATSSVVVNGTVLIGTLVFGASGNTLANLTVNIAAAGSVLLGSNVTVAGTLALNSGSLDLNGKNLTIEGTINASGSGSIGGNILSNITFNGTGNAGTLVLTTGKQVINNLTANIGSSGSVALGSNATVGGTLTLAQGNISIGNYNLTIAPTATVQGGSSASYIITNATAIDTGSLKMTLANAGVAAMYQVGTVANYAPVNVTNNSALAGTFGVIAHPGVYASGTTGTDLSVAHSVVNTSWDITSSLAVGNNVSLVMFWNTAMQVNGFNNTQAYVSHFKAGAWDTSALSAATVLSGGTYSLALTGVTSFSPFAVFDKNTATGVQDITADALFQIYPNPVAGTLNIYTQTPGNFLTMKIYNVLGNQVLSQSIDNSTTTLDVANFAKGVYLVSFSNGLTKRFIKD